MVILPLTAAAPRAQAAPAAPSVVFSENFQNISGSTPTSLTSYTGANGMTYTASAAWLPNNNCNGVILSFNTTTAIPGCQATPNGQGATGNMSLRALASALGTFQGNGNANAALAAFTDTGAPSAVNPGANQVQFQMNQPIPLSTVTSMHYITVSVNVAVINCPGTNPNAPNTVSPKLQFNLLNSAGTAFPIGGIVDPCLGSNFQNIQVALPANIGPPVTTNLPPCTPPLSSPNGCITARVGTFSTSAAISFTGQPRLQLVNAEGSGFGNDAAIDNITVLDATPGLSKAFSPTSQVAGLPSRLTFTITNTTDLLAKPGWSFTDSLPSGVRVANPPNPATTCSSTTFNPASGATSLTATGSLLLNQASCTVSVDVTGVPGTYANGPANITTSGLIPPTGDTTVTFVPPAPAITVTKTPSPSTATAPGTTINYSFVVTNTGNVDLTSVLLTDAQAPPAGGLTSGPTCPQTTLAVGASMTCTATYVTTLADVDHGAVNDTATVTGSPPAILGLPPVTGTANATVTIAAAPALSVTKAVSPNAVNAAGTTVTYTFGVQNTGNVTVHGVAIAETAFSGSGALSPITCLATTLAPGASTTCTATYTITVADMDAGTVTNTAHATGLAPSGSAVNSPSANATVTTIQVPRLALVKSAALSSFRAGQSVTYTFEVTNTGNVTVHGIAIVETAFSGTGTLGPITCQATTLAPGDQTTCTASYILTVADVDAGHVTNTAEATGTAPNGSAVTSPPSTVDIPVTQAPALSMVKSASPATVTKAGDTVTYTFAVTNTGNVTIHAIAIDETAFSGTGTPSAITCTTTTLAPGESTSCTATYTITQADMDAGTVTNTAHATGTAPNSATVNSPSATATVTATQTPALSVAKSVSPNPVTTAGTTVTYSFGVHNTGNVTVHGISIAETAFTGTGTLSPITCTATTLAPGASTTCTATYTITQADIDAGHVNNTAHAAGTAPDGTAVSSPPASATVTVTQAVTLTLSKSVSPSTVTDAGDTVTYTFAVTNTGNVTITGVSIAETAFSGSGALSPITCLATTLAPGASTTCTATYTITQADMDAGTVTNTAHATGSAPSGNTVISGPATATVTATAAPALSLVKSASGPPSFNAGQVITYSFEVTNTGNVTIHGINIVETAFNGSGALSPITCPVTTLAPGDQTTCTATYTLTVADIDRGEVTNTAHATGTTPGGTTVNSPPSTVTVPQVQSPALAITKTATPATVTKAGDTVTYDFEVTNTGNVTIHGIAIDETAFSGSGTVSAITCTTTTLAPGEFTNCTASYTITQADMNAGTVTNTAHATGTAPNNSTVNSPSATATVTATQTPALFLVKSAVGPPIFQAGQTITYSFEVTNTGNVTVHSVAISEVAFSGTGALSPITCPDTTLAPGEQTTCTATYVLTVADIDSGELTDTAEATGTAPDGSSVVSKPSTVSIPQTQAPALDIAKTATPGTVGAAGDTVTYTFHVTNTGNVTIHGIAIAETAFSGTGALSPITCQATTLAPGESTNCTATYTITQADMDAGKVTNTAEATGTSPSGAAVTSPTATATVTVAEAPALKVVKSASPPGAPAAGEVITYTFEVTNTGNVTVHGIAIAETAFSGTGSLSPITCLATTLAPGEQTTCTGTYAITTADIDAGHVTNTAEATGTSPGGGQVTSPPSTVTVPQAQNPALTVSKSVSPATVTTAGTTVTYSFGVTNDGNVTIHGITINETAFSGTGSLSPITCAATTLAPGESTTCSATYAVTQGDIDAGTVTNTAVAAGTAPNGATVTSPPDTATVTASQSPVLALSKTASPATVNSAGDTVTYTIRATNPGNVTVHGIVIDETAFSGTGSLSPITCTATTLAPGASTTCTATYTVTQADIDAGHVTNTALAAGTAPNGTTVTSPPDTATVTVSQSTTLEVNKTVSPGTVTAAGEAVTYRFLVTNNGNVTVSGITIDETAFSGTGTLSAITCTATTLAPGASTTCTATYTVTQADIDAGGVTNTALAAGTAPDGTAVISPESSATLTAIQAPALGITKTVSPATVTRAGDAVTYSFHVTNNGNTTIHGISIDETAFSGTGSLSAITCPVTTLAPGVSTTCTATYAVTQADMDAGTVTNTAHAAGFDPNNAAVASPPATATVTASSAPELSLVKSAVEPPVFVAGQVVTYNFHVTNTGNVTVHGIAIDETAFSGTGTLSPITCPVTTLVPGASTTCTATYTITQADIDAGVITNTAEATGTAPDGAAVTSPPSSATVPAQPTPELSVTKSVTPATVTTAGTTVTYSFDVTNKGNVTIHAIAIDETAFSGTGTLSAITCAATTLAPGASTTCTATYDITQADMDAGHVTNTAHATGLDPTGGTVTSAPATATVTVSQSPVLTLNKTASPATVTAAGDTVTYTFDVANPGNVTVHGIVIIETAFSGTGALSAITCTVTTLAPGASTTCTATYNVTQADMNAGHITNTALADGTAPDGMAVTSPLSAATVTATPAPALDITKTAAPSTVTAAGNTVTYSFEVTNTGNVTIHGIAIDETAFSGSGALSAITCPVTTLAPGVFTTCTATYTITQADIDAGTVTNTARTAGTAPDGAAVTSPPASAAVTVTQTTTLTLNKTASPATVTTAGTTVTYSFEVTNTGNVTIHGIAIAETAFNGTGTLSPITCTATTLAPGASTTCTATYTITQADIDAGKITNTAEATGLAPDGATVTSPPSTATVTAHPNPTLTMVKSANPATVTTAGTTVTYSFEVTNTGNVTIHGIAIAETAFNGTGTLSPITCPVTTLAPGEDTTCTATYTITQADIDAGQVSDTAHATGNAPDGTTVTSAPSSATVTASQSPVLALTKTASPATVNSAGDTVTYTFEVTNTGNVTIHGIAIAETAFSGTGTLAPITCAATTLAPGEHTTCTATVYTVTQADIDAGQITNSANATGIAPDGASVVSPLATAVVVVSQAPTLAITKTASPATVSRAGATVTYTFEVTNTGNVTIHGINIDETAFSGTGNVSPVSCLDSTLLPGQSITCTATYQITQADIDAGHVNNTAEAIGFAPDGAAVTSPPTSATVTATQTPALALVKSASGPPSFNAGQVITYTFEVTNTGNVTIHAIAIDETQFTGTGSLSAITCTATTLAPGEQTTCTATYTLTQADIDAGHVTNTAEATGTAPDGSTATSPPSTVTVPGVQTPGLTLIKTASPATVITAGDGVTYTFEVTNTGNVTIHGIAIDETAFTGTGTLPPITCTATTLAPGASTTCTTTYSVTQADIDAGKVTNTAHATGTSPSGAAVNSPDETATVTASQTPDLDITKTATPATVTAAGDTVTYTFHVTNAGNVTIHAIAIDETAFTGTGTLSPITCTATTLAPGASTTCTATYTVTVADVDAGHVTNTAVAAGLGPDGTTVTSPPATATVTVPAATRLTLSKSVSPATVTAAGDTVTYTFHVTNDSNVTVHGIAINETAFSGTGTLSPITCTATTLAPGASTTCTATYTVTQADIDAAEVTNTALATGLAPDGTAVVSPPSSSTLTASQTPALGITKTASPATVTAAGATVTYTFHVTNAGNVTVDTIAIDETTFSGTGVLSPITCTATTLAPGASATCTATYTITQADIDAGHVTNTANAIGFAPDGAAVTSPPATATVTVTQTPALALVKSASGPPSFNAGQVVTYSFEVTNTGNVTIHAIAIDETAFTGTGALSAITCTATTLAPGEQATCTATYVLTQADIDAGFVTNTAEATGTEPDGGTATSPPSTVTVPQVQAPALDITKTATPATVTAAGDTVTYTFDVTNAGNVTIHAIAIDETAFTGTGALSPITCTATTLAPGESTTCTATYVLTQADIDAGKVTNTAHATGTAPSGAPVDSPDATATVTASQTPDLDITKTASPATVTAAGDTVTYTFHVTNAGNVTIHAIAIDEIAFTGTGTLSPITCTATTLAPGASTTCTATYTVTVADVDAGHVTNTAHAVGTAPDGTSVTSPPATATVTVPAATRLTLSKTVSPATVTAAGDTVTYTFDVTNTGNVTIHAIAITETAFSGTGTLSPITCTATTLAPGASATCTATYAVTQADIDAAEVTNTALATGTAPDGTAVVSLPSTATLTASPAPALTVTKTAAPATVTAAGDTVTYTFDVTNTGNVTVDTIAIDESAFSGTGTLSPITCTATTLAPGASATCTATYTVTQDDIDAGHITNTAHATGFAPDGTAVNSSQATATVKATQTPALALVKSASGPPSFNAGQVITYSFEVTNTGNVTIHAITIDETQFTGTGTLSPITCTATTLAPGEQATCTATYVLTQADIDAGHVTNTAEATGKDPSDTTVTSPPSTVTVPGVQSPALDLTKIASPATVSTAGEIVTYSFEVTNTGNVTIHAITIDETQFTGTGTLSPITCPVTTLFPGEITTCTATYIITQADIDAGTVTNAAKATGTAPSGAATTSPEATATVTGSRAPALAVTKSASPTTVSAAGDAVTYSFEVTNTGNVTIHAITIDETAFTGTGTLSPITCTATTLAPGASTTCTAAYTVTQADIDAGKVANTAEATGKDPTGAAVASPPSSTTVTASPAPALSIVKSASGPPTTNAGQPITYSFDVTNTGNVTIHAITIDETAFTGTGALSAINCPVTTLAPRASTTCTASYLLTQADIDAGKVANTAEATGKDPSDTTVTSPPSTVTVPLAPAPALELTKTASPATVTAAGDMVTYSFEVTNTGNVTIHAIAIDETQFSGTGTLSGITCTATTLAPGEHTTCTATYAITQADMDAGKVTNTAQATGKDPNEAAVISPPADATVTASPAPALALVKSGALSFFRAGQTVTYTFEVTNTGNVTIHAISIDEIAFSGTGTLSPITCLATTLAPGEQTTCTATYLLTLADIDAGKVTNTAEATGTSPDGSAVTSPPSTVTLPQTQTPGLAVVKSASPATVTAAGDAVTYSFEVTNTGNVTIHAITIDETAFTGTGTLSPITCPVTTLVPGEFTTCTATYTVTQADIDGGKITNTAHATGLAPSGAAVTSPPATATVAVTQAPALSVVKSATPATVTRAGETVTYDFDVTNTGNVTIHAIAIKETAFTGTGTLSGITCLATTLAPGEHTTCTATYTITQADMNAGHVTNTAHATGKDPSGAAVTSPPATATVTASQAPALSLAKSASPAGPSFFNAGQTLTYHFLVTNTGNVTIHAIANHETAFTGTGTVSPITCPATTLAPGEQTTCSATYTITQADVDAGKITNTAHATGTAPDGATVTSPPSTATVPQPPAPALSLRKTGRPDIVTRAGERITYSFAVTNTGNVTIHGVTAREIVFTGSGALSAIVCPVTTLAPGERTTCTATYTTTQADIDAGKVVNTAHATGTAPNGAAVTSPLASATVTARQHPALAVVKRANTSTAKAGETITYSFAVTNTGNVTIHAITVHETSFTGTGALSPVSCPVTTLAPGAHTTCTATYVVTEADADAGMVANTATATGKLPSGRVVTSAPSTITVKVAAHKKAITSGVPGNGSGPSMVKIGLGAGLILIASGGMIGLITRRRRRSDGQ